jgi:hypothetical protein
MKKQLALLALASFLTACGEDRSSEPKTALLALTAAQQNDDASFTLVDSDTSTETYEQASTKIRCTNTLAAKYKNTWSDQGFTVEKGTEYQQSDWSCTDGSSCKVEILDETDGNEAPLWQSGRTEEMGPANDSDCLRTPVAQRVRVTCSNDYLYEDSDPTRFQSSARIQCKQ